MNSGIYTITNIVNGKRYIGSSKDMTYRWSQNHRPQLRAGNHHNRHLQAAWNKYGEDAFKFQKVEECKESLLLEREGYWIENYRSWEREYGYNLIRIVDGKQIVSEETRKIMSTKNVAKFAENYWQTGINAKILQLYKNGKSKNAIAIELGVTRSLIYSCLEQNGLHKNTGAGADVKLTPDVKAQILQLREEGKTAEEIIEISGVSRTQLYRTKTLKDGKYGGKIKREKYRTITPEVIEKARYLRSTTNMTWQKIADECGVSREWLSTAGVSKGFDPRRGSMDEKKYQKALQFRKQGFSWEKCAKKVGVSAPTLRKYRNKNLIK